jgi:hypothetical protein
MCVTQVFDTLFLISENEIRLCVYVREQGTEDSVWS